MLRNREILLYSLLAAAITVAATLICLRFSAVAALVCLGAGASLYAAGLFFTLHRYRKIAELSNYLQRLARGGTALDIRENSEGELSILKNEIYKATVALSEQAAALQQDKLELAGGLSDISHQLKTPLTSLHIMSELLAKEDLPPHKRQEFADATRAQLERMEWLVLALLKLARLDADAARLKQEPIPLAALVEKALGPLLIPMEIRNQTHSVSGEASSIACDWEWTTEALDNIIKNAVENTPEGGHIAISYGENPLYAYITVHDNGPGVPPADLPHLFQRFYRGQQAGRNSAGIGLAFSLAVMRRQNGDIEVKNENGGKFTLKFYYRV